MREVAAEEQIKTAEKQILRDTYAPLPPRTALSTQLHKLAAECRTQSDKITYADLQEFLHAR